MFYTSDKFWQGVNVLFIVCIVAAILIMSWHHARPLAEEWATMTGQWWRSMRAECVVLRQRYDHAREADLLAQRSGSSLNDRMTLLIAAIEAQTKWSRCVRGEPTGPAWRLQVIPPK